MTGVGITYSTMISMVRSMCHIIGDVPYSNAIIIEMIRASLGEAFSLCGDLHERYWMKNIYVTPAEFPQITGLIRVVSISNVLYIAGGDTVDNEPWQQASLKEVLAVSNDDSPDRLWAHDSDGEIVTSIPMYSYTLSYIKDPSSDVVNENDADTLIIDMPMAIMSVVLYKTAAKLDAHTNMERAQGLLLEANNMLKGFIQSQIMSEDKGYQRRKDFTSGQSAKFIVPTEF